MSMNNDTIIARADEEHLKNFGKAIMGKTCYIRVQLNSIDSIPRAHLAQGGAFPVCLSKLTLFLSRDIRNGPGIRSMVQL